MAQLLPIFGPDPELQFRVKYLKEKLGNGTIESCGLVVCQNPTQYPSNHPGIETVVFWASEEDSFRTAVIGRINACIFVDQFLQAS